MSVLLTVPLIASSQAGYHLDKKIKIGGNGGWDYLSVDSKAHRVYIARGSFVSVIDVAKGREIGKIEKTQGVHGVAIVNSLGKGYTSNGGSSSVTVFNLKTLKPLKQIMVGKQPDAIIYDPKSNRVFTFNAGSTDATAIDVASDKVVGTVPLGGKPEFAVSDLKGHVYVNIEDKSTIKEIDSTSLKVLHTWPISPGEEATGLAIDIKKRRLFAVCGNGMMVVMNANNGKIVATPKIGRGPDACEFDAASGMAFSSNGEGTITAIKCTGGDKYVVADTIKTMPGARTMILDHQSHVIYLCSAMPDPKAPGGGSGERRWPQFLPNSFTLLEVRK